MILKKSSKQLVEEAFQKIENIPIEQALSMIGNPEVLFVDIREIHELDQFGTIPTAFHAPRGILEFLIDPESPYFNPIFEEEKKLILFCRSSWRSALATVTLQEMGLKNVAHLAGGYDGWVENGGEIIKFSNI